MARRGANEGTIRLRPDGRWEARYRRDGLQRSVYGDTRKQVVDALRAEEMPSPSAAELRRRAEAQLKPQRAKRGERRTEADMARLVHELEVHQVELEMQNEELQQTRAKAEALLVRYTDLYDFAPTGYFNLARDGTIHAVNLNGARLLGIERALLLNRRLGVLVAAADRPAFNAFLGVRGPAGVPRRHAGCHRPPPGRDGAGAIDPGTASSPDPGESIERSAADLRLLQKNSG